MWEEIAGVSIEHHNLSRLKAEATRFVAGISRSRPYLLPRLTLVGERLKCHVVVVAIVVGGHVGLHCFVRTCRAGQCLANGEIRGPTYAGTTQRGSIYEVE